jgi:hypothetical protein
MAVLLLTATMLFSVSAPGDTLQVAASANDDTIPQVVCNTSAAEYVAVWQHAYRSSDQDIRLRRFSMDGLPLSAELNVVSSGNSELNPALAYNSATDNYLVVYEFEYSASDHDIYAMLVGVDGTPAGSPISITAASNLESNPCLSYSLAVNRYLIVWVSRQGADEFVQDDIYGRWINADGSPVTDSFMIAGAVNNEFAPAVAAADDGTCLVVWQARKDPSGDYGIYSRRVGTNGELLGGEVALSTWEYDQVRPRLVFNPAFGEYLVVWEDHHWGWGDDWDIYGRRVSAGGVAVGGSFGVAWETANHCLNPDVVWQPADNRYLVAYEFEYSASDHDIYSRALNPDGTVAGDSAVVSGSGAQELYPSAAAAEDGSYFIAWSDARNVATTGMDIYAFIQTGSLPVFSGHVYLGPLGNITSPISGVTVALYGSNNEPDVGTYLTEAQSDAEGLFSLPVQGNWEYYNIIVQWPQGYTANGAESLDGDIVASDWIRFAPPQTAKNLAANAFYFTAEDLAFTYGPVVEQVTQTSAVVVWQTNRPADSRVEYGPTARMGSVAQDTALDTAHSVALAELSPSTTYTFVVTSADSGGRTVRSRTAYFETSASQDSTPPTVSITDIPVVRSALIVAPEVADNVAVQMVQFFIDDTLVFSDFSSPYEFNLDTATLADGDHLLKTSVFDTAGNMTELTKPATSAKLVDAAAPAVTITSPAYDDVVSGKVSVVALLSDDTALRSVLLSVDAWMKGQHDFAQSQMKTASVLMTWDSTDMPNGRHRIGVTAYDADWKSGQATVDVIVNNMPPPPPPKLIVTEHMAIRYGNYLRVGITVENIGQSTARNIIIRDNLLLFQPIAANTTEAAYTCQLGPSHKGSDCIITPTMSILAGNSRTFTYDAVPILVHPDTITPMIGNTVELTWDSSTQGGFSADFQPVVFKTTTGELMAAAHKNALKACDYLIVTSPDNLMAFNPAADVNALLSAMAQLAKLKTGALGFLYGPPAFFRDYQAHDGFAVGDVLGDDRDEIIVGDVSGKHICTYVPDSHEWFLQPKDHYFKPAASDGFESGDRIAVGLLPGGTKQKIVMSDHSADQIIVYNFNGTVDSAFSVEIEPWDALAVGDVFAPLTRAEIILGDRSAGKIVTYNSQGAKLQEFTKAVDAHDGLTAGDILGDTLDEIVFADLSADKIYIYSGSGLQLGAINCQFDEGDSLAVADIYSVWPNDKDEIIITDHSADLVWVYKGDGTLLKSFKRSLDSFDGLAAGRILSDKMPYILLADQSQHAIDAISFAHETADRNILADLIKAEITFPLGPKLTPTGQWSSKLKDGWISTGYLLIVGETEIVPAWGDRSLGTLLVTFGGAASDQPLQPDVTDYPYANTYGEEIHPELAIGRIIGNTAKQLIIPIQTSINVATGAGGYGFDRSHALTISGFPATLGGGAASIDFKSEVTTVTNTLTGKGLTCANFHAIDGIFYNPPGVIDTKATSDFFRNGFFYGVPQKDVIFLAGHGSANGWDEIGAGDILGQTDPFGNTNPFVFPSSCSTGSYHGTVSFAESLLQRRAGAVLAATRWGLSSHAWISNYLFANWAPGQSVGDIVRYVKQNIGDITVPGMFGGPSWTYADVNARYWSALYHVFGDPKFGMYNPPPDTKARPIAKALSTFDVFVPDYEVEHLDGLDHVSIPGGIALTEPDMPTVPAYRISYDYPRNARIQNVILQTRSEPAHATGLILPITQFSAGGTYTPGASAPAAKNGENTWWPDIPFTWSLTHGPDRTTLAVTVYPFVYNAALGEAYFHNQYSFAVDYVESDVDILALNTDRTTYDPGDRLTMDLLITNPGPEPQTLVLSGAITSTTDDAPVLDLPCRTLRDVGPAASWTDTLDTRRLLPGSYTLAVVLTTPDGLMLDTQSTTFRIGSPRLDIDTLQPTPTNIMPDQDITLNLTVRNTGSVATSGLAVFSAKDHNGQTVADFEHPFDPIAPGESLVVSDSWNTSQTPDTSYTITAHVLYNGCSTPLTEIWIGKCTGGLLTADLNSDCYVDMEDMALIAQHFSDTSCDTADNCDHVDIVGNTVIDLADLLQLAVQWLLCNDPANPDCN